MSFRLWARGPGSRRGRRAWWMICCGLLACLPGCGGGEPTEPVLLQSQAALPVARREPIEVVLPDAPHPLLVEILGAGAALDTRLIGPDQQVASRVQFDYLRSVPMYHYVDAEAGDAPRQVRIIPLQAPSGARATVNIYALPGEDLAQAWRELARGQRRVDSHDDDAWTASLAALAAAEAGFERLDRPHPALWAAYLRAYLQYFPLYRYDEATAAAHRIMNRIDAMGRRDRETVTIEVLARQLAGQILLESGAGNGDGESPLALAREHFEVARDLAAANGLPFEETWAINNLGIAYYYEDKLDEALEHYAQALRRAEAAQDSYLVALVGTNVAVAQERLGHIDEAVLTLDRIRREPTMQDSPAEREHLLGLLGNYYLKLYRFPEALEALNEALQLSDALGSSATRGLNRVRLGRAYREMGQPEKARSLAQAAIPDLETAQDPRALRQAHRLLADLARLSGDFDAMAQQRLQEQALLGTDLDRAEWLYSQAEDALARGAGPQAARAFRDSAAAFAEMGFTAWSGLAELNACAAERADEAGGACSIDALQARYERIRGLQLSAPALRGRFAWARLLAAQGRHPDALTETRALIDDMRLYRRELPGVLGAWYWDARQQVFDFYLQLLMDAPEATGNGNPGALLALDRLRNSATAAAQAGAPADSLRALLARRDRAESPEELMQAQGLIDAELARRLPTAPAPAEIGAGDFLSQLEDLPADWSLLAYYLAGARATAWVGNRDGLRQVDLGPAGPLIERIDRVKSSLRVYNEPSLEADLADLGKALLEPVRPGLRFNVLVAGGGILGDLPMEALLIEGQPLLEEHQLLYVRSVANPNATVQRAAATVTPRKLFLAGAPGNDDVYHGVLPGAERELAAVQAAFPGSEAAVFTRQALDHAAFQGSPFRQAELIHLASHALIDREYPELSRLLLSENGEATGAYLTPADLAGIDLAARLVVLSACETVGLNHFEFDDRLGFVTQFLDLSEGLVVASLWPVSDSTTSELMADFYRELAATGNVPASLRTAKLRQLAARAGDARAWAAFQLFAR